MIKTRRKKAGLGIATAAVAGAATFFAVTEAAPFRIELAQPNGTIIPCGSSVSGIGTVLVRGYATSQNGQPVRTRGAYRSPNGSEVWYAQPTQQFRTPGQEELLLDEAQDLNNVAGVHEFRFGDGLPGTPRCSFTASNIRNPSEGITTIRPLAVDPVDGIRISLARYADGVPIPCGSSIASGRTRWTVEVRQVGEANIHAIHTHHEDMTGIGPNQGPDPAIGPVPANTRRWEKADYNIFVPSGNVWTVVSGTTATATPRGLNTFHAAEGFAANGGIEVFCSFTNTGG